MLDMVGSPKGYRPSPGDFSLCILCGSLNIFDEELKLRQPTVEEYVEATKCPEVQRGRKAILAIKDEREA
jgi:hypothetical protein